MSVPAEERRRTPRVTVREAEAQVSIATSSTVQMLDISQSGVLLSSAQRVEVGQRAHLRTRIGPDPLSVQVEIRRVTDGGRTGYGTYRLGAEFVGIDEDVQRRIERFLKVED